MVLIWFALLLTQSFSYAEEREWRVTDILSGDTGTLVDRTGKRSSYFHLAGCEVYEPGTEAGKVAKLSLEQLIKGKLLDVGFIGKKGPIAGQPEQHVLVEMRVGGKDVCTELAFKGQAVLNEDDEKHLSGLKVSMIKSAEMRAKQSGLGIWSGSKNGQFAESPAANLRLHKYKYQQVYVNGASEASRENFNRPSAPLSDPKPSKNGH